jgi:crotonobetainyl-CoA:carnitine CoA-transferase CaiB-like acyl-CoA transferase
VDKVYRALGREDLRDDPRFADAVGLRQHRTEVIAVLDEIVAEHTLAEWAERFDREDVWWAPAQSPADVLVDPQLVATDGFLELRDEAAARCTDRSMARSVSRTSRCTQPRRHHLGEHTAEVLAEVAPQD